MADIILQVLQWAVPGGIGGAVVWLFDRKGWKAETAKKVHDAYRAMYEEMSKDLTKQREQNERLYKEVEGMRNTNLRLTRSVNRLSNAIETVQRCSYHDNCPVLLELQLSEEGGDGGERQGGSGKNHKPSANRRRKGNADQRDGTDDGGHGGTDDPSGQDSNAS